MSRQSRPSAAEFHAKIQWWAARIGVQPKRVQLQRMTKKWASCSPGGRICFSTDLLVEDAPFRELVIVHELLHLQVPNHGKLFKSLLTAYVPNWESRVKGRFRKLCGYRAVGVSLAAGAARGFPA
jgi:predicted metal-dependent hydrolase